MKHIILFIVLCSLTFASYGPSEIKMERTWSIENSEPDGNIEFEGFFVFNRSYQTLLSYSTDPKMNLTSHQGFVKLYYAGPKNTTHFKLNANALVEVDYTTYLYQDPLLVEQELGFDEITKPNKAIRSQAAKLKAETTLQTIRNITSWLHKNIEYDILYPRGKTAQQIFKDKRGLCIDYSHLFISMAHTLGLKTRYVSGYVIAEDWQAHSWVDVWVPEYGWLPVDPTFGEVGVLDNSHIVIGQGSNNSEVFDNITSTTANTVFYVTDDLKMISSEKDPDYADLSIDFDEESLTVDVTLENPHDEYIFGTYGFSAPKQHGGKREELILLAPSEEIHFKYVLLDSLFEEGYAYTIPVSAYFNDAEAEKDIVIKKRKKQAFDDEDLQVDLDGSPTCVVPVLVFLTLLGYGSMSCYNAISKKDK